MDSHNFLSKGWTGVTKSNKLTIILLLIYLIVLFWIIVLKFNIQFTYMGAGRSVNLIPYNQPLILNGKISFSEIILNILIFIPLGLYIGILFKRWIFGKKLLSFFLVSLIFEMFQFVFIVGAFDITDIINNTFGGIIGLGIYKGIERGFQDAARAQRLINIIAIVGTILFILLFLFLKINRLFMFRM